MVVKHPNLQSKGYTSRLRCHSSFKTAILAMNNQFLVGTHVCFWDGAGQTVYGTVRQVVRGADGTVYLEIATTTGRSVTLPAAAVQKVT